MANRPSWKLLLTVALVSAIVFILIGYLVLFTAVLHWEIRSANQVQPTAAPRSANEGPLAFVSSQIRNVFGDPVPYAVVYLDGHSVQADSSGYFSLDGLKPGRCQMEIFAGGYRRYKWDLNLEEGENNPTIKYETGLWPQEFLPDFHVFYNESERIFGIIGFANGSSEPVHVHQALLFDPEGNLIEDLLAAEGLSYFTEISSKVSIVSEPRRSLSIPENTYLTADIPPLDGPAEIGSYRLEVHYSWPHSAPQELYIYVLEDYLDEDSNWNPHLP